MSLLDWQTQFSQALLLPDAPELCKLPSLQGIEGKRIALYEELMFNTVLDTLQNIYPYTYRLLSREGEREAEWVALAEQYRRGYPNQSYKLMGAVCAFPEFLAEQGNLIRKYPFLTDLALYEWLEMVVLNLPNPADEIQMASVPAPEAWAQYSPVWNAAAELRRFNYHVPEILELFHLEDTDWKSLESGKIPKKSVDILIYRDPQTMEARFFCLNGLTARLIQLSTDASISYAEAITRLQQDLPTLQGIPAEVITQQAAGLFQMCLQNGMLLGSSAL